MKKKITIKKPKQGEIKVRKTWDINPCQKVHSTKKGKRGYDRQQGKRIAKGLED